MERLLKTSFIYLFIYLFIYTNLSAQIPDPLNVDINNFTFIGQASLSEKNRKEFKISDASKYLQPGCIEYKTTLNLTAPFRIVYFANFGLETSQINETNGDGMAFVLHRDTDNNSIRCGNPGAGIGYAQCDYEGSYNDRCLSPSIGIEFDTYFNNVTQWAISGDQINPSDPEIGPHISFVKNGNPNGRDEESDPYFSWLFYHYNQNNEYTRHTIIDGIEDGKYHCIEIIWEPETMNPDDSKLTVKIDGGLEFNGYECYINHDLISNIFNGENEVYWSITGGSGIVSSYQLVNFNNQVDIRPDIEICYGDEITLASAKRFEFGRNEEIEWIPKDGLNNPYSLSPIARPKITTTYRLRLTSPEDGQIAEDYVKISVDGKPNEYFIKSYLYNYNNETVGQEINGLIKDAKDCGYIMSCQAHRFETIDDIYFHKVGQLMKLDCDGEFIWGNWYYRDPTTYNGDLIHLCASKICNVFDNVEKLHFNIPYPKRNYFKEKNHIGYAFAGSMDYGLYNEQKYQMYTILIDENGNVMDKLNFEYENSINDYGCKDIKQLSDGSIFLIGGIFDINPLLHEFIFTKLKLIDIGGSYRFGKHKDMENINDPQTLDYLKIFQIPGYSLIVEEFIESSNGNI